MTSPLDGAPTSTIAAATLARRCAGRLATIVGTSRTDRGTAGQDVVAALGGDDVVLGAAGSDLICLGAGADQGHGGPRRRPSGGLG